MASTTFNLNYISIYTTLMIIQGNIGDLVSYDLMKFSDVKIVKTLHKSNDTQCKKSGYDIKCPVSINSLMDLKKCLWKIGSKWNCQFDKWTKAVQVIIDFNKEYVVNNFLLSFKEAQNITAISVEIYYYTKKVHTLRYAANEFLCEFYFPDIKHRRKCEVKQDLYKGIINIFKEPITGQKIIVRFFPPVVNTYDIQPEYLINQLYIGGSCVCSSGRISSCIIGSRENFVSIDGKKNVLLCPYDQGQYKICTCSRAGTRYGLCNPFTLLGYSCPCKGNYSGDLCDTCAKGWYGYPNCKKCSCNTIGSVSRYCSKKGDCQCGFKYSGEKCDQCASGRYNFPHCYPCPCSKERTKSTICDSATGACHCQDRYDGEKCTSCKKWLVDYPICRTPSCKCSAEGSVSDQCTFSGACECKPMFTGNQCNKCIEGYGHYPECVACQCNAIGSLSNECDSYSGQCKCKPYFTGKYCEQCTSSNLIFPHCVGDAKCECNKIGTWFDADKKGPCIEGSSCLCKQHVIGLDCSRCQLNYYNLSADNFQGCTACDCWKTGTHGKLLSCDTNSGQCFCKNTVSGRKCNKCAPGYHSFDSWNLFGCTACDCDIGGSVNDSCSNHGNCKCKENVAGKTCNTLKEGNYYVPDFYHNLFEAESGVKSKAKESPVELLYNEKEFLNFTGKGYVRLGLQQPVIKIPLKVPKTRNYFVVVRYTVKEGTDVTMLVNLMSKDREISHPGTSLLPPTKRAGLPIPSYGSLLTRDRGREFLLTKGLWDMEISTSLSELYIDHVVIIPEEYYSGDALQPQHAEPCKVSNPEERLCLMYRYIDIEKLYSVQGESGTNSKGYGNELVSKTNVYNDPDILLQLPVINAMAELSRNQIALTLQISAPATDVYVIMVTYFNPNERTYRLDLYDSKSGRRGYMEAIPCSYKFLCRLVLIQNNGNLLELKYRANETSEVTILGNVRESLAIDFITLIPLSEWSADYLKPFELCYMKKKYCQDNIKFHVSLDSIEAIAHKSNPANPLTKAVHATSEQTILYEVSIIKRKKYHLIYQYYQPTFPSFVVDIKITTRNGIRLSSTKVKIDHCGAKAGCRKSYLVDNYLEGDLTISFELPKAKELWLDSVSLVPLSSYTTDLILRHRTELSTKFKRSCVDSTGLPLLNPPVGFCSHALFTLTTKFNEKVFKCNCSREGSQSAGCTRVGGQCKCRKNVIGKQCNKCKTGYYGFPRCKPCRCFIEGSISPDCDRYGQCQCKKHHDGIKCDRCKKGHYGYPECKACNCDRRGSFTRTCRRYDGQCPCLRNYGGRQCNQCRVGYFDFPSCRSCNCVPAGILLTPEAPTGCYQYDPNRCDCKQNVEGSDCGTCKDNHYGLNQNNPLGCAPCNCSTFGTIPGADGCDKKTGKCKCQPNIMGRRCDQCMDGYYTVPTDKIFSCQPCLCSESGSLSSICDKQTGKCSCKVNVEGNKCDKIADNFYFPSFGQIEFTAADIIPYARYDLLDGVFDGISVNETFASAKLSFNISSTKKYYLAVYYALLEKRRSTIKFDLSSEDFNEEIKHTLRGKKLRKPYMEILKEKNKTFRKIDLTAGQWNLHVLFNENIMLNQITLIPYETIKNHNIVRFVRNPCVLGQTSTKYCSMYTYHGMTDETEVKIELEEMIKDDVVLFDKYIFPSSVMNGAILFHSTKDLSFNRKFSMLGQYLIVAQYANLDNATTELRLSIQYKSSTQEGFLYMHPCNYSFACREVVVGDDGQKVLFSGGNGERSFSFKIDRNTQIYLDNILLIPVTKWTVNLISPSFYCTRRENKCMQINFPTAENSFSLETKDARGMGFLATTPPGIVEPVDTIVLSAYQRNFRWQSPMATGGFYVVIHYYQPLMESFVSKVVITTYQRAIAAKVNFDYCVSIYGCRVVVKYLEDDIIQRFFISGNILRATFTLPWTAQVWVKSLIFVPPNEYIKNPNILSISPFSHSKKFLRKCIGRKYRYIQEVNKEFCESSIFDFTLSLNLYPQVCSCNRMGTMEPFKCNFYDGVCPCKPGFKGRDCGSCEKGSFPQCESRRYLV